MGREIHIVRIPAINIEDAIKKSETFMKAKDHGEGYPYHVGAYCPETGDCTSLFHSDFPGFATEEEISDTAKRLRFDSIFAGIPRDIAPWKVTPFEEDDVYEGYNQYKADNHDNEMECTRFCSTVTNSAEEKQFALPLLKLWMQSIADGNSKIANDPDLNRCIERLTDNMAHYPFSYNGSLYDNRCHRCEPRDTPPEAKVHYVLFRVKN